MRAPAAESLDSATSNALATSASMPSSTAFSGAPRRRPASGAAARSGIGSPANTASIAAQQATELASGPIESRLVDSGTTPVIGTRRAVGL